MIRKKLSALVAAAILLRCFPAPANAGAALPPGRHLIASFRESALDPAVAETNLSGNLSQSGEQGYGQSAYALRWILKANSVWKVTPAEDALDWKQYESVTFRVYCADPGNEFNIIFYPDRSSQSGPYSRVRAKINTAGWQEITAPVSALGTCLDASASKNSVGHIAFNAGGWAPISFTPGTPVYFDSVWLTTGAASGTFDATETSIEDEASFVPPDLDGNNTFWTQFGEALWNTDVQSAVSVAELTGDGELPMDAAYTVSVSGSRLSIVFAAPLTPGRAYVIRLDREKIYSASGKKLSGNVLCRFTVGAAAPFFEITQTDGSREGDRLVCTFYTNNQIDGRVDLYAYVAVYSGAAKLRGGYSVEADGRTLRVSIDANVHAPGPYRVLLRPGLTDLFGNALRGEREFSFSFDAEGGEEGLVAFSAGDPADMSAAKSGGFAESTDAPHLHGRAARFDYPAGSSVGKTLSAKRMNASGYRYLNYWVYSPAASDGKFNFLVYTSTAQNKYFWYAPTANWEGWKLLSIPLGDFTSYNASWADINSVMFNVNGWSNTWSEAGYFMMEQVWFSRELPAGPAYVGSSYPVGYAKMPVSGSVDLHYDSDLAPLEDGVVTMEGGLAPVDFTAAADGKKLTVRFSGLLPQTAYTISVGQGLTGTVGLPKSTTDTYRFTTAGAGISADAPLFTGPFPSGAQYSAVNTGAESVGAVFVLGVYDEDGRMLELIRETVHIPPGESASLILAPSSAAGAAYMKAFVLQSDGARLLSGVATAGAYAAENSPVFAARQGGAPALTLARTQVDLERIAIRGTAENLFGSVLLTVTGHTDSPLLLIPAAIGKSGAYRYDFVLGGDAPSGTYTVLASSADKTAQGTFDYIAPAERNELLQAANGGTPDRIRELLTAHSGALGLAGRSALLTGVAQAVAEQKPYAYYGELLAMTEKAADTLGGLNALTWSTMTSFLASHAGLIIDPGNKDYQYYTALGEREQNRVNQKLAAGLPVDSFGAFRRALSRAVVEYKKETEPAPPSPPGDSPSGGNGPKGGISFDRDMVQPPVTTLIEREAEEAARRPFGDLSPVPWAVDSISALYEKGIVSPAADKRFRPLDNVSREEFIKLLVEALGVPRSGEPCGFTDADAGAWYCGVLGTARAAGIIEGYTDGTFGVGASITREDMAVMAQRGVLALGKSVRGGNGGGAEEFSDAAGISAYAAGAVALMRDAGILAGMGDGRFAPREVANRAQAAKMIAKLMDAVE